MVSVRARGERRRRCSRRNWERPATAISASAAAWKSKVEPSGAVRVQWFFWRETAARGGEIVEPEGDFDLIGGDGQIGHRPGGGKNVRGDAVFSQCGVVIGGQTIGLREQGVHEQKIRRTEENRLGESRLMAQAERPIQFVRGVDDGGVEIGRIQGQAFGGIEKAPEDGFKRPVFGGLGDGRSEQVQMSRGRCRDQAAPGRDVKDGIVREAHGANRSG